MNRPFRAKVFKVGSLATGGVSVILHVEDEDADVAWALSRRRGETLMVAVEEIGAI